MANVILDRNHANQLDYPTHSINTLLPLGLPAHLLPTLISKQVPIEQQAVSDELRKGLICKDSGLVLIGGAAGSGKATLISGVIDEYAKKRELGADFLRQGSKDIVAGDMRGHLTVQEALKAASKGYRVFGTIHANTVADIPARIVFEFPEESRRGRVSELLSISKLWIVQRLEVNPKGGLTALRSHLSLTPKLTNSFYSVNPDNIRSFANDLVEEHGVPMHEAARLAYESGDIEKTTYEKIKWGA